MRRCLFMLVLLLSVCLADLTGRVIGVSDGDTITILCNKTEVSIRLAEIDCPEKGQPYGKAAKRYASELVFGRTVRVHECGKDRYGRTIGTVIMADGGTLNRKLVRAGFAWWYFKFSDDIKIRDLENKARKAKRGLWAGTDPIPPWKWRKGTR